MGIDLDWTSKFILGEALDTIATELQRLTDDVHDTRASHYNRIADILIALQKQAHGAPWFEWNGQNLTQFGTAVKGSNAAGSPSPSVVALGGTNWIEITATAAGSPVNQVDTAHVLPISTAIPSGVTDYIIMAEFVTSAQVSDVAGAMVLGRWVDINTAYALNYNDINGTDRLRFLKFGASESVTVLGTATDGPDLATTNEGGLLVLKVDNDTVLTGRGLASEKVVIDSASPHTAAGAAAIGVGTNGNVGTSTCRFRNIRCYSVI